jgi:hypothetical protein
LLPGKHHESITTLSPFFYIGTYVTIPKLHYHIVRSLLARAQEPAFQERSSPVRGPISFPFQPLSNQENRSYLLPEFTYLVFALNLDRNFSLLSPFLQQGTIIHLTPLFFSFLFSLLSVSGILSPRLFSANTFSLATFLQDINWRETKRLDSIILVCFLHRLHESLAYTDEFARRRQTKHCHVHVKTGIGILVANFTSSREVNKKHRKQTIKYQHQSSIQLASDS